MRISGILLLLLVAAVTRAYPYADHQLSRQSDYQSNHQSPMLSCTAPCLAPGSAIAAAPDVWRYSDNAPFYEVLPNDVRELESPDPDVAAERICASLGGETGFVESPGAAKTKAGFLCRFVEPDVTMSIDFGDLHRIPSN